MKSRFSANLPRQASSYRSPVSTLASPRAEGEERDVEAYAEVEPPTPPPQVREPPALITTRWAWSLRDEVEARAVSTPVVVAARPDMYEEVEAAHGSELDHENWLETLGHLVKQVQSRQTVPLRIAPAEGARPHETDTETETSKRQLLDSLTDIELVWAVNESASPALA